MTIHYDAMLTRPFHHKYPGGLEQFATDYEEAYCELARIGENHPNFAQRRKILTNLESKLLVAYCERKCVTSAEVIDHLTDTYICDSHYNSMHCAQKAKTSQTTSKDFDNDLEYDSDLRFIVQSKHGKPLPPDYKIPTQAWQLLSPKAKEAFISAHDKIIGSHESGGGGAGRGRGMGEYRHLFPNSMEALDMMKFKRQTCQSLGERGMHNLTWMIVMTSTKQPLPDSSRATKPVAILVVSLVWSKLIHVPFMLGLIPLAYIPSPLVSPHKTASPFLLGCVTPAYLVTDGTFWMTPDDTQISSVLMSSLQRNPVFL
jgi:hypothetical protein